MTSKVSELLQKHLKLSLFLVVSLFSSVFDVSAFDSTFVTSSFSSGGVFSFGDTFRLLNFGFVGGGGGVGVGAGGGGGLFGVGDGARGFSGFTFFTFTGPPMVIPVMLMRSLLGGRTGGLGGPVGFWVDPGGRRG